ncbi:PAS domain-containing hybrid sensor histidine kinase/response regulator [Opitutus terrae]|uniref:histidine kinase n=1 Tax=Opitutus terrae (strain DSM 11246 / JCM 15787 / PB90-1) TaxID=452637 RepID=B1ZSE9_OPITP|nr:ATP-binding protein [Opitutus terrae]ACB75751.1 PAS/PAC sensor hybrid histidine kinase [Opitutus terrae PB90-1]
MNEPRPSTDPAAHRLAAADVAAVLLLDSHGRITGASASARALWQAAEGGLIGEPFASLFAFEVVADGPEWFEAQWEVLRDATLDRTATLDAQPRDGAPRAVQVRLERFSETFFLATVQPPAAAPTAPSANGDGSAYQLVAEQGAAGFFDLDLITNRATYSRSWKKMLGYVDAELPDTLETWRELIHPDDSGAAPDQVGRKPAAGARPFSVEFRMRHRLGHWVWVQCVGVQVLNATGQLERVVGLNLDVSERKEIEEASLANDERMETLGGGPLGAFDLDFTAKSFWFSPAWKKILGYRDDELADTLETLAAVLPADEIPGGVETWLLLLAPGQNTFVLAEELVGKDGQRVPVLLGAHRTLTRKRDLARIIGFICTAPTLTPRSAGSDDGLGAGLAQDAFAALAEGVLVTDATGRILHANPAAVRLLARKPDEIVGAAVADVFQLVHRESGRPGDDPCDRALGADQPLPLFSDHALVVGARPPAATDAASSPAETALPIVWTARASKDAENNPRGVVIVFRDPGEMSLTPEELVKANRFESLGLLAGGIAHDFNNLLATILAGVSLAKDNRNYSALEDCEKACLTAKGLTKQLLAFAKGGAGSQSVISPKEILQDAVKIAAAGSDAEITVNLTENVDPVRVDRAQILQVFQNLIVNALQAMPPKPHRAKLQLTAKNVTLAADQIPPLAEGNYVEIEVRDNGSGIAPENLQKIFDPFFTTKKHGTGLGLATVLSIVRKHGGQIAVDSVVGTGTAFTAFFPRADAPVEVQARRAPSLRFGTGRILLMDDDPKLSELTATMLESLDYKFDLAKNGEEAIQLYKRYLNIGRPYDVALLDITVVGGMGGEECFKALRDLDPEVRAIVSSGYDNEDMARRFLDMGFCGYLTKPYRVTDLGKVLKAVLG